jgi:hypothetical protein
LIKLQLANGAVRPSFDPGRFTLMALDDLEGFWKVGETLYKALGRPVGYDRHKLEAASHIGADHENETALNCEQEAWPMNASWTGKRVVVLSDNRGLSRVIEFSLKNHDLKVIAPLHASGNGRPPPVVGDIDLIIVAVSLPTSEALDTLSRASLSDRIGQVPLLIICDGPAHSDPGHRIEHLGFPFGLDGFYHKVETILQKEA